ncbi:MAG: VWA domain-containing protein [Bacteroidetes bacterium]|nr:VWA domain-containing protein [Bacteroidota bacterium]
MKTLALRSTMRSHRVWSVLFSSMMILLALSTLELHAQPELTIDRTIVNWPEVILQVLVTCDGNPAYSIGKEHFRLFENSREVTDFTVWSVDSGVSSALSAVLVFDASGSMTGANNAGAKAAGRAFIDEMDGQNDEAAIVWFNSVVQIQQQMTSLKPMLYASIDALPASGGTAVWDGCYAGVIELINNSINQCRAVIVLSDGLDNSSTRTPTEVAALARRNHVPVYTVSLGSFTDADSLEYIATETGGQHYQTDDPLDLEAIYQEIFEDAKICFPFRPGAHVITYQRACADGTLRWVELQLVDFCDADTARMATTMYKAPLDSATFTAAQMELGDGIALAGKDLVIPFELLTPLAGDILPPFTITVSDAADCGTLTGASAPQGTLLEGVPVQMTPIPGGYRIETTMGKRVTGSGILLHLHWKAADVSAVECCDIVVQAHPVTAGCVLLQAGDGRICVLPGDSLPSFDVDLTAEGPLEFCEGGSVMLDAGEGYVSYAWNTGERTRRIAVHTSGTYFCILENADGEYGLSDTLDVTVLPTPHPILSYLGSMPFCVGDSLLLEAPRGYLSYAWNSGGSGRTEWVYDAGEYWVTVTDSNGCPGVSDTIVVFTFPEPEKPEIMRGGDVLHASSAAAWQWYRNGQPIPGATDRVHVMMQTGTYTVEITDAHGCKAMSDPFDVSVLGVEDLPAVVNGFDVYPNPSDGRLTLALSLKIPAAVQVSISDVLGREMRSLAFPETRLLHETLDLGRVTPGHYLLRVRIAGGGMMTRVVTVE